jgi:hypothetical protein
MAETISQNLGFEKENLGFLHPETEPHASYTCFEESVILCSWWHFEQSNQPKGVFLMKESRSLSLLSPLQLTANIK